MQRKITFNIVFLFILLFNLNASAQTEAEIDSLNIAFFSMEDAEKALELSHKTYILADKINYSEGRFATLNNIINAYKNLGDYDKTLEYSDKFLQLAKKENNYYFQSYAYSNKAIVYIYIGFLNDSKKMLEESEKACSNLKKDDSYYSAMGVLNFAKSKYENAKGNTQKNVEYAVKSTKFYEKIKNEYRRNGSLATQYANLSDSYSIINQTDSAIYYGKKSLEKSIQIESPYDEANAYFTIANAFLEMKKSDSALYYFKNALPIFSELKDKYQLQLTYEKMSLAYEGLNDSENFIFYSKKAKELSDSLSLIEKKNVNTVSKHILSSEKEQWDTKFYLMLFGGIILLIIITYFTVKYFKNYKTEKRAKQGKEIEITNLENKVNDAFEEVLELAKKDDPSFLTRFKEVYPEFYHKLTTTYPSLTVSQLRFCAIIKLNFSTKEIAHYHHMTVRGVQTKKNRLRKQLEISSEEDLNKWMMDF